MRTYLVTGGAGFIGSHLIEALVNENNNIICLDDLSSGFLSNIIDHKNVKTIIKSIQDVNINELESIDGIFHLAAQASVPKSIDDFYNSSSNNLLGTLKVFDFANKRKTPIVYASSSAVYGNLPEGNDTIENFDILSPYAQDKLSMEHYAEMVWNVYQTKSIGLRFFNVFGPKQDPKNPYSGVISIFIDRLLKGLPVTVNGGHQTRDFIYVKDVAKCLVKSMEILHQYAICEVLNVGTGKSITINDLLETLIKLTNKQPDIIKAKLPNGDPEISIGTYSKLSDKLKTNIDDFNSLSDGLNNTIKYYKNNE